MSIRGSDKLSQELKRAFSSRLHGLAEVFDCCLNAARAVGNTQCCETQFDNGQCAKHHWCIDVAHVSDAERLALDFAKARTEHDATIAVVSCCATADPKNGSAGADQILERVIEPKVRRQPPWLSTPKS